MKKSMCIEKNVTVVALWYFFRKWLSQYVEIVKCVADCMIWFKFDKCIMPNNKNVYMCAIFLPPDKNVYYRKYNIGVFDVQQ
jgi:hypothetical protein